MLTDKTKKANSALLACICVEFFFLQPGLKTNTEAACFDPQKSDLAFSFSLPLTFTIFVNVACLPILFGAVLKL